MLLLQ